MKLHTLLTISWLYIVSTLSVLAADRADIQGKELNGQVVIYFTGVIAPGDAKSIADLHNLVSVDIKNRGKNTESKEPILNINSKGGNVTEAMKIGRWIRQVQGQVAVGFDSECFSSCIYVLAGGMRRWALGEIGIHRPFLISSTTKDYGAVMRSVLEQSRKYFFEMNIPEKLADDMFAVEPEYNKILSQQMLTQYRLDQIDIGLKEKQSIEEANRLGLSRQEYNARRARFLNDLNECALLRPVEKIQTCATNSLRKHGLN